MVGQPQGAAPTFYDHAVGGFWMRCELAQGTAGTRKEAEHSKSRELAQDATGDLKNPFFEIFFRDILQFFTRRFDKML